MSIHRRKPKLTRTTGSSPVHRNNPFSLFHTLRLLLIALRHRIHYPGQKTHRNRGYRSGSNWVTKEDHSTRRDGQFVQRADHTVRRAACRTNAPRGCVGDPDSGSAGECDGSQKEVPRFFGADGANLSRCKRLIRRRTHKLRTRLA